MTTVQWIILDHVVALLGAACWFAAGATAALQRPRLALGLFGAAVLAMFGRAATVVMLAGRGWWFAQEKVLLGLPLLAAAGLAAVFLAGPRLLAAARAPGASLPPAGLLALFTAGFAALAGPVVTFLAGYPLTWATALITVSVVCVGALLTWRVVAPPAVRRTGAADDMPAPPRRRVLSRRGFMLVAARVVAAGAGLTGAGLLFRTPGRVVTGGGPGPDPAARTLSVADLRGPGDPASGGSVVRHTLTARTATVRLPSGGDLDAWTYDGALPGPPITAVQGDLIETTLRNADIAGGVTVHWHGYDVRCGDDGAPGATQHAVAPGDTFVYRFRADQVGTYWYHTHQGSHIGVRKGLYGTLVVTPRQPLPQGLDLTLPVHTFDSTVLIGTESGRVVHTADPGAPVRLRLVNTDSTPHRFAVAGAAFRVAAVDGRDLNRPGEVREVVLRLPAGGRYDVVLTMPDTPVAVVLDDDRNRGILLRPAGSTAGDPVPPVTADWAELDLLHYGEPAALPFDAGKADRHFTMVLDRGLAVVDGSPAYASTVNGHGHPSIPDQLVAEGDVVRYTVVNRGLETHPWHLHGHTVLIVSRNGTPCSGSPLWVDTFDVRPGEIWDVAFQASNPGVWMNHCHNLPHQDQGMMLRLVYDGVTTPFADGSHAH
ncbi:multicopper oxidase family protein [Dactylosporangium sp. NBC_01737]|uniref:multicopper oxidase family protein n=1 Tax=Dactylosporangium sp. NBC_01737 TaxID=2975959 RepID=UPI002E145448|nr:multicopper oxidase family protein [Dactylosporangium sp. NBC_01737]